MNLLIALIIFAGACMPSENNVDPDSNNTNTVFKSEKINYRIDTIAMGLNNPWGMTFLPGGDLLVTERDGEIRIIRNGKLLEQKISGVPEVYKTGQGGLFEIKLHPDYKTNGWLYISYAAPGTGGGNTAIMRAKLGGFNLINKSVIFQAEPFFDGGNHFGGRMTFGRDGLLYFSVGERGKKENAQKLSTHAGKILRIKDDGSIPSDNPFVNTAGAKSAIYAYGNRNPQGMAMNPATGQIWTHEHGPMGGDEINIVERGANYGWPEVTFGTNYDGSIITNDTTKAGMKDPLHYWLPSIAPCGMDFVTSDLYGPWKGNLLVGSLKFQYVARLELDGNKVVSEERIVENFGRVRAVTQGPDGYIYVSTEGPGMVLRIVPE